MAARCHWFWWSTSATDSRYLWRIPSTIGRTAPPHLEDDALDTRGAGDGPRPDAGGHLELLGTFVPEPRLEAGEAGRARVDADLGRRDLAERGAPDLPDARHRR